MLKFIFALCFFFSQVTYGQQALKTKGLPSSTWNETLRMQAYGDHLTATGSKQYLIETGHKNLLVNESFEASTVGSGWTVGFSSPQIDTTVNMPPGKQSLGAPIFSGAGSQLYQAYADCSKLYGQTLEASIHIKSTATTGQVCSVINGTDYECITMNSSDVWKEHTLNFAAPSSGSCGIRVKSTGSAFVNTRFDDAYLGLARNIGTAAQASFYGGAQQEGATNCAFLQSTSSGESNYVDLGAAASCASVWSSYGNCAAVGPTSHQITCTNMPPGDYKVEVSGPVYQSFSGSSNFRFSDGTNTFGYTYAGNTGSGATGSGSILGRITYATPGTRTFKVQSSDSATGDTGLANNIAGRTLIWRVYRFPTTSEQVTRPNNSADLLGTIFYTPAATCPTNSVQVNGQTLNATTHAALIAKRTADGISSPSVLENLSGLFIRSAGTQTQGGVAHTSGALGAFQADQMQGHRHSLSDETFQYFGRKNPPSGIYDTVTSGSYSLSPISETSNPKSDGTNGTPRTGTTTRPANRAFTPCMWFVSNPAPLIASSVTYSNTVRAEGVNGVTSVATGSAAGSSSNSANVDSITSISTDYIRVGNRASFSTSFALDATASGQWYTEINLPLTGNFTNVRDVNATCTSFYGRGSGRAVAVVGSNRMIIYANATDLAVFGWSCSGTYEIK